jgi:uncharacterized repeat protein (TIGR03803 family)
VHIAQNTSMSCTTPLYSRLSSRARLNKPIITVFEILRGGGNGFGTVFKITLQGKLTTLHHFEGPDRNPVGVVQATDDNFYGTTRNGGTIGGGTVFRLSVRLGPFVEPRPVSGKAGATIIILGNNLIGATDVSFNGTAAAFTVVSSTEITTTVPDGATTGQIEVTIPSGTLTSNVNFHVQ